MHPKKLLIVGGGNLCLQILQILAPRNAFEFHVASRNLEATQRLCNLVRLGALQLNVDVSIRAWKMDLTTEHIGRNAELLSQIKPDIILNCASLQSWRVITQLPKGRFDALDQAQLGPWLPMHLAPAYALMRAVKHSGVRSLTVNAAFPDVVNAVLYKVGMNPDVGVGNIANLVPATRCAIARLAHCEPTDVRVKLIGQHYFSHSVPRHGLPTEPNFHLSYWIGNEERSERYSAEKIFGIVADEFRRLGGIDGQFLTAMSAVSILDNLFCSHEAHVHAPGPHGLPGGYPVKIGQGKVLLGLPYGVQREEAIKINEAGQLQDGIQAIHADGSVTFAEPQMAIMEELLGFHMPRLHVQEAELWACELGRKYKAFADNHSLHGAHKHVHHWPATAAAPQLG
jgi:hypothetical protein